MKKLQRLVLLLLAVLALVIPASAQENTIVDIATSNEDFSTLVAAMQAADPAVLETLQGDGSYTVFAPTNQAFENLLATLNLTADDLLVETELLTEILLYHVVSGNVMAEDVIALDGQFVPTLLDNGAIFIEATEDGVVLNDVVNVIQTDIEANNGVIHVIDNVLLPTSALVAFGLQPTVSEADAAVRVMHLSPDAPNVDVYVNGEPAITDLAYSASTQYMTMASGTYEIAVAPTGTSIEDAVIGPAEVTLIGDTFYNIAAVGTLADNSLTATVFTEPIPALGENEIGITALHALFGAPDVDVVINGTPAIETLAFPFTQTDTDGELNDGAFSAILDLTGVESITVNVANTDTVLLDLTGTALTAGSYYVVAVSGTADAPQPFVYEVDAATATALQDDMVITDNLDDIDADVDAEDTETNDGAMNDDAMQPTIAELVINTANSEAPEFTILLQAVQNADPAILEALQNPDADLTVFAPTDEAFRNLLSSTGLTADDLLASPLLTDILLYHVVQGEVMAETVLTLDGATVPTLLEDNFIVVTVNDDNSVVLNAIVNVIQTDVDAGNGVIHVIDEVLLPASAIEALGL